MINQLIFVFLAGVAGNILSTLRIMFLGTGETRKVYVVVFIDTILFASILKNIFSGEFLPILAFAIGKVVGTYLAGIIEGRVTDTYLEVSIVSKDKEASIELADALRLQGFYTNNTIVYGKKGRDRYETKVIVKSRKKAELLSMIEAFNFTPQMITACKLTKGE